MESGTELSIIPQLIAVHVGLSFMLEHLNSLLEKSGVGRIIRQYYFPIPFSGGSGDGCGYAENICWLLYRERFLL